MATLAELAAIVGGAVKGDPQLQIQGIRPLDEAEEGDISFLANPKYRGKVGTSKASAVIVPPGAEFPGKDLIVCSNPYLAFAKVVEAFHGPGEAVVGIQPGAQVDPTAILGEGVSVAPGVVIGPRVRIGEKTQLFPGVVLYEGVEVGADCLLHANAVVRERCVLGDRVILQPSAVIGSDGFGYAPDGQSYYKIPQVGIVHLEDDVEIGSCSCIDRAAMGVTRIRRGTKIDNLVQIAHNVDVGEDSILVSQVGIAGSTRIGKHCTFGGQAAAVGHVNVGDNVMVGARGALASNTEGNQVVSGAPAIPHRRWLKTTQIINKLPDLYRDMQNLKQELDALKKVREGKEE